VRIRQNRDERTTCTRWRRITRHSRVDSRFQRVLYLASDLYTYICAYIIFYVHAEINGSSLKVAPPSGFQVGLLVASISIFLLLIRNNFNRRGYRKPWESQLNFIYVFIKYAKYSEICVLTSRQVLAITGCYSCTIMVVMSIRVRVNLYYDSLVWDNTRFYVKFLWTVFSRQFVRQYSYRFYDFHSIKRISQIKEFYRVTPHTRREIIVSR